MIRKMVAVKALGLVAGLAAGSVSGARAAGETGRMPCFTSLVRMSRTMPPDPPKPDGDGKRKPKLFREAAAVAAWKGTGTVQGRLLV